MVPVPKHFSYRKFVTQQVGYWARNASKIVLNGVTRNESTWLAMKCIVSQWFKEKIMFHLAHSGSMSFNKKVIQGSIYIIWTITSISLADSAKISGLVDFVLA